MSEEIWKDIPGYEGLYWASNLGRIRSKKTILRSHVNNSGYQLLHLYKSNKAKAFTVHRLVAITFLPNPDSKPQVDHIDCDKKNNCVSNLRWISGEDNMRHASATGRLNKAAEKAKKRMVEIGSKYGFSNSQKHLIKAKPIKIELGGQTMDFKSMREAAKHFGVCHSTVRLRIKNGTYKQTA